MRCHKSISLVLLSILIVGLCAPVSAQAAGGSIRTIPVNSKGFVLRLSPDGRTAVVFEVAAMQNGVDPALLPIQLFDIGTGKAIGSLTGTTDYATDAAFTPDGKLLVTSHQNGSLYLWDVAKLSLVKVIETTFLISPVIRFLPDGKALTILTSGLPARFILWDTDKGQITSVIGRHFARYDDFKDLINQALGSLDVTYTAFEVSPDGKTLVSATANDEVDVWDVASGKQTVLSPAAEKKGMLSIRQFAFSPDGKTLFYSNRSDKQIHRWDMDSRAEVKPIAVNAGAFALSADGSMLAWLDQTKTPYTLNLAELAKPDQPIQIMVMPASAHILPRATALFFAPNGKQLILGGLANMDTENDIWVIDLAQG